MSGEITVDRIRAAVAEVADEMSGVAAVYLYGSRVHGTTLPLSDIDLAVLLVDGEGPRDPLFAESFAARVSVALRSGVEIDAHLVSQLPLPVLGRVVTDGHLIHEGDASRRVEFETSTRRLYFDFLPLLERDAREGLTSGG